MTGFNEILSLIVTSG
jgi:hypothetical protein